MQMDTAILAAIGLTGGAVCGCAGGGVSSIPTQTNAAAPTISVSPAQNGAVMVSLATTTSGATIYYTLDRTTPNASSQQYFAPFLVASSLTVESISTASGHGTSNITSQSFVLNIPSGTLVWSDEFNNYTGAIARPNPLVWSYDSGNRGFGNHELEIYCAWGSNTAPCSAVSPNAHLGTDGYLHIKAQQPSAAVYTSARLKSQGKFSFRYGRFEMRAQVPEAQGYWPAGWLLGNNVAAVGWPGCGEMDVMERVNAAKKPDWNESSIHGTGFTGDSGLGTIHTFPSGQTAAEWHTYGMIWSKGLVAYYIDDPSHPYVTYTPSNLSGLSGAMWPFDAGQSSFIVLNLAIGGNWPGAPSSTTPFPGEMLVDYVRVYTN